MKKNKFFSILAFTLFVGLTLASCDDTNKENSSSKVGSSSLSSSSSIVDGSNSSSSSSSSSQVEEISVAISGEQNVNVNSTITLTATVQNSTQGVDWSSDHEEYATVTAGEGNTATVRGIAAGQATITATSKEDATKKATIAITVVANQSLEINVAILDFETAETPVNTLEEGSGAYSIKVSLENLPSGKTENDVTITWPLNNAMHTIVDAATALQSNKFIKGYVPVGAGRDRLEIKVNVAGDKEYTQVFNFPITRKDADYTVITTPKQFIDLVEKDTGDSGKYLLGANLDLTGYVNEGGKEGDAFTGTIDGNGYTIKGFTQKPKTASNSEQDGGFFLTFDGILRNIRLEGNIDSAIGFSGVLAKELLAHSVVQDVIVITKDITPTIPSDWTWQRNGTIAALAKGLIMDSVLMENPDGDRNDRTITTAPYGLNNKQNPEEGRGFMYNVYTNGIVDGSNDLSKPFDPDPGQAWCSTIEVEEFHNAWDYTTKLASDYTLDSTVWTLADHQLPKLAHDGDNFVTMSPSVEITGETASVKVGQSITLTAVPTFVDSSKAVTYSFASSEQGKVNISNEGAVATVTGAEEGTTNITCTMTYEGQEYTSAPFAITVQAEDAPEHTGQEIKNLDDLKAFFDGTGANSGKDAYLSADIDCTGWDVHDICMAGEFSAKFDGAGHRLYNLTIKSTLFNIIGTSGSVFDLTLEGTYTGTAGFAYLCYSNNGLIHDVTLKISIDTALGGTPNAPFAQAGNGTIRDCEADVTFVTGKACTNYFAVQAGAGATIENVTVTYHNATASGSTINPAPYADQVELINGDEAA